MDSSRENSASLLSLFRDCGVSLPCYGCLWPWLRPDGTLSSRIDFIGCPYSWIHLVQSCDMLACPFSDHCAVVLSVPIPEPTPREPRRWKFNILILKDADFRASVSDFWAGWRTKKPSFDSLQLSWDVGKNHLKSLAIKSCNSKTKQRWLRWLRCWVAVAEGARISSRTCWAKKGEASTSYFFSV